MTLKLLCDCACDIALTYTYVVVGANGIRLIFTEAVVDSVQSFECGRAR